jgi:hypothetical protein
MTRAGFHTNSRAPIDLDEARDSPVAPSGAGRRLEILDRLAGSRRGYGRQPFGHTSWSHYAQLIDLTDTSVDTQSSDRLPGAR